MRGCTAFITDSNCPQPLRQHPPTACLTASGATSEVPSLLMHPRGGGGGRLNQPDVVTSGYRWRLLAPPPPSPFQPQTSQWQGLAVARRLAYNGPGPVALRAEVCASPSSPPSGVRRCAAPKTPGRDVRRTPMCASRRRGGGTKAEAWHSHDTLCRDRVPGRQHHPGEVWMRLLVLGSSSMIRFWHPPGQLRGFAGRGQG